MARNFHQCGLMAKYFQMIENETKTIEGRINTSKFVDFKIGDLIEFANANDTKNRIICEITRVIPYKTFREMLVAEKIRNCLPDVDSIDEGVRVYYGIPGYKEKEQRYGVLAFGLRLLHKESVF